MKTTQENNASRSAQWGWRLLIAVSVLWALNGVTLYFFIADSDLFKIESLMEFGMGMLMLAVVWEGYRHRSRWAWIATWVPAVLLALVGIHVMVSGDIGVSFWYFFLTVVALAGQLLARRYLIS
jgi:hypothetical protein